MGVTIKKSQQQQNHSLRTDSSLSHRGGGGLNAFYWHQILALDSPVAEIQEMFSSHGGLLTNAMQCIIMKKHSNQTYQYCQTIFIKLDHEFPPTRRCFASPSDYSICSSIAVPGQLKETHYIPDIQTELERTHGV